MLRSEAFDIFFVLFLFVFDRVFFQEKRTFLSLKMNCNVSVWKKGKNMLLILTFLFFPYIMGQIKYERGIKKRWRNFFREGM